MNYRKPRNLSAYVTGLIASGRLVFAREEAMAALGVSQGAFLDAAEKLQKRGQIVTPRRGFYVVVPPQYLQLGSPPPSSFIDDLMRREGLIYYVGLLKAAELHGAAHQAVMEFQIVTGKQLPATQAGRSRIAFYFRKDISAVESGIEDRKTDTGTMKLSSPELTLLDLLRYPHASGGNDNVVTVLHELAPKADAEKLAALCSHFERPIAQRAGYLLDNAGFNALAENVHGSLQSGPPVQWVELDRSLIGDPELAPDIQERNKRWRVIVRHMPESDDQ